jgi:hypothetical protein
VVDWYGSLHLRAAEHDAANHLTAAWPSEWINSIIRPQNNVIGANNAFAEDATVHNSACIQ